MVFSPRKNDFRGNFLFQILFLWLETLFFKGFRRKITQKDLFPCPREQNSQFIFDQFDKHWQTELGKSTPDIKVALAKTLKTPFLIAGLFHFLEAFFLLVQAILVTEFSSLCVPSNSNSSSSSYIGLSLSLALCISLISLFLTINHSIAFDILYCVGMQMRTICITAIFKKVLRMQQSVLRSTSAGHIINLASNDVYKFDLGVLFWNFFWISPLIALMCTAILLVYIGPIGLIGVLYILLHTPLQVSLGLVFGHFRHLQSLTADKRILLMDQVIRGIRVIKFYVWESSFIRLVSKIRRREVYFASISGFLQSTTFSFFNSSLFIALFLVYAVSVTTGDPLSPSNVGLVFLVLNTLRIDMVLVLGHAIFSGKESVVALRRIQQLLELPEDVQASFTRSVSSPGEPSSIRFSELSASWSGNGDLHSNCLVLKSINLELIGPLLVVVTGPVSAGKSSLLLSLLNELPGVSGHLRITGVPSYAAPEPWIFSGTIRDNILFGNPLNGKRYWRVINACSLKVDIDSFDGGDLTLIGERGVTLSGGQKARVSLARSVYHQADIYLFDDPLSAVDSQVGRELFHSCMRAFLSGKLILLVTHQIYYVRQADYIVLMRDGAVMGSGSYEEVIHSSEFCRDYLRGLETVHQTKSDSKYYISHSQTSYASNSYEEISVQDESRQTLIPTSAGDGEYTMPLSASLSVEQSQRHSHSLVTYLRYFWAGGFPTTLLLLALTILSNGCLLLAYWWMQSIAKCAQTPILHSTNSTASYACSWDFNFQHLPSLGLLGFLTLSGSLFMFLRGFNFYYLALQAGRRLHNRMLSSVMRTRMYFYDTNQSGRILNRFSKDVGFLDEQLPIIFYDFWQSSTYNIAIAIVCCAIQNTLIIPFLFLCIATLSLRYWYLRTSTQVKRLESISRSPLYSHISLTLQGLSTIRALGMERRLTQDFYYFQDEHTRAWYHYTACQKWFGLRLDVLTAFLAIFGILSAFVGRCVLGWNELTDFSIPLLLTLPSTFQYVVRLSGEVEILMVSADRILNYCDLPREQIASGPTAYPKPNDNVGHIEYKNIFFSYADELPYSLVDVSFSVYPGEKVGVIGRTGAGKSSLFNSLFLTNRISAGRIYVDDVDISTLSVSEHRRRLSIIPQDPFLFSGTLRQNLDPLGEFSNEEIWIALDKSHLKRQVQSLSKQLLSLVAEHGYNFSTGERQLLCIARAMLRRNKIILVDEATANVDLQTDSLVQQAIRTHFSDCSVLTIAHRIETILDSDKIVVLEHGRVVETEIPFLMLQDSNSYLSTLLSQLDTSTQSNLRNLALENYNRFVNSKAASGGGQCAN